MSLSKFAVLFCIGIILSFCSCDGGKSQRLAALEAERDSLMNEVESANVKYSDLSDYLLEISACIDSIALKEKIVLANNDPETGRKYTRTEIRNNIKELGAVIERQRCRIAELTETLGGKVDAKEVERLTQLVTYLNDQLAAKEAQLQQLQNELASSRLSIADLKNSVALAQATNQELTNENQTLDQMVVEKTDQLNQAWLLAKTKKELENMGVLTGGKLLKKSKFNPGELNTSECIPIDIRTFTEITLHSKKRPVLLSQAPASSYRIDEISKDEWKLVIVDTISFWTLSKIVVIQLQ